MATNFSGMAGFSPNPRKRTRGQVQVIFGPMFSGKTQTCSAASAMRLQDLAERAMGNEVIGIDEGQFFPDCVDFAEKLADQGKIVIVAALDGTFQRVGFGNILNLVPLAESVVKLNAVCMTCYGEASYTKRLGYETELEVIGGADKYMAACRKCYKLSPSKIMAVLETPITEETQIKAKGVGRKLFTNSQSSCGEDEMMSEPSQ